MCQLGSSAESALEEHLRGHARRWETLGKQSPSGCTRRNTGPPLPPPSAAPEREVPEAVT